MDPNPQIHIAWENGPSPGFGSRSDQEIRFVFLVKNWKCTVKKQTIFDFNFVSIEQTLIHIPGIRNAGWYMIVQFMYKVYFNTWLYNSCIIKVYFLVLNDG